MTLANQIKVRGNLLPEGVAAPISAVFPPDAEDGQTIWKTPEQQLYVYRTFPLDNWYPVGASSSSSHYEPVVEQVAELNGRSFASVRADFFNPLLGYNSPNRGMGTWLTLYRHCYWQFTFPPSNDVWSAPRHFDKEDDLYDFLESYVPSLLNTYTENIRFRCYEVVDDADYFPTKIHYRNSLAASIMGRRRWVNKIMGGGTQYYGVDPKFNTSYYLNYNNELGRRFVMEALGSDPGSNNDDIVWFHYGKRGTLLRYPLIGSSINARGFCWDNSLLQYVPAVGGFEVLAPFYLVERFRQALLSMVSQNDVDSAHRSDEMRSPVVAVFPLVQGLVTPHTPPEYNTYTRYAFMVVPINYDNFVTEWLDTSTHEISLCIRYRDTYSKVYDVSTHHSTGSASSQVLMWTTPDLFMHRNGARLDTDIDADFIPVRVDMAKRDLTTGARSNWTPLYTIRRHVKHAGIKISPARHSR